MSSFLKIILEGLTLLCCGLGISQASNEANNTREVHQVTWTHWRKLNQNDKIEFFLDGKSLGSDEIAKDQLVNMKFKAGTLIKMVLPDDLVGSPGSGTPVICLTKMLQDWIEDGVDLEFEYKGIKVDWHTLFFRNMRRGPFYGSKKSRGLLNSDTAIWYFDGLKYFDGPSAVQAMKKHLFGRESAILVLFPSDYKRSSVPMADDSEIDDYLDLLQSQGVTILTIGRMGHWSRG